MRRAYLVIAAAVMIAGLGAVGVARAPLASAAPCWGVSCHGYDPATTGCNQYYSSPQKKVFPLATVVNWYSTGCNANWTQAWLSPSALAAGDTMYVNIVTLGADSQNQNEFECYPGPSNTGKNEPCWATYGGTGAAYTDMVDGTNVTSSGVIVFDSAGNYLTSYNIYQ